MPSFLTANDPAERLYFQDGGLETLWFKIWNFHFL